MPAKAVLSHCRVLFSTRRLGLPRTRYDCAPTTGRTQKPGAGHPIMMELSLYGDIHNHCHCVQSPLDRLSIRGINAGCRVACLLADGASATLILLARALERTVPVVQPSTRFCSGFPILLTCHLSTSSDQFFGCALTGALLLLLTLAHT
jgi:hypothetical protein